LKIVSHQAAGYAKFEILYFSIKSMAGFLKSKPKQIKIPKRPNGVSKNICSVEGAGSNYGS
jgi:hypothetical protein